MQENINQKIDKVDVDKETQREAMNDTKQESSAKRSDLITDMTREITWEEELEQAEVRVEKNKERIRK